MWDGRSRKGKSRGREARKGCYPNSLGVLPTPLQRRIQRGRGGGEAAVPNWLKKIQ